MDRRSLFKVIGVGALAAGTPALLTGCGESSGTTDVSNSKKALAPWPTHVPFAGPKADLPGDGKTGVRDAFLTYPGKLVTSVADKPGDGSDVTALVITYGTPPAPVETNEFWQAVNKALGVNLKIIAVPANDYPKKLTTLMASGDLPDMVLFGGGAALPRQAQFIASQCQDLSEFLGGDNVKAYPNLANIPTGSWQGMGRIAGRIYGVPIPRPQANSALFINKIAFDKAGIARDWTADQVLPAFKALTGHRRWALGAAAGAANLEPYAQSFGAPNTWQVKDGSFTHWSQSDAFREAVELMVKAREQGSLHPDFWHQGGTDVTTLLSNGTIAAKRDGVGGFNLDAFKTQGDTYQLDLALPFNRDAGYWLGAGLFGFTVFKKASAQRVKLLLRILNLLAAPFGTTENELVNFGVEGIHFTRGNNGGLVLTDLAKTENPVNVPVKYIAAGPMVSYFPGHDENSRRLHTWETEVMPKGITNPENGLVSTTYSSIKPQLDSIINDTVADIILGREPMSALDEAIKKWKATGGTKASEEFAREYAAAGS
ncbi:extracellular solute-binding protein [Streptomyces sp. NPDC055709]